MVYYGISRGCDAKISFMFYNSNRTTTRVLSHQLSDYRHAVILSPIIYNQIINICISLIQCGYQRILDIFFHIIDRNANSNCSTHSVLVSTTRRGDIW